MDRIQEASLRTGHPEAVAAGRWSSTDWILGGAGGAMILAAIFLLVRGGVADGSVIVTDLPAVAILQPADGASVREPLEIQFVVSTRLESREDGWGAGPYHLHLDLNGRELMPGPADLRQLQNGAYSWLLPEVGGGEVSLVLRWSDSSHRAIPDSSGDPVVVKVGP
jgi:hypothetical protein